MYTVPKLVAFLQEVIKNRGDANIYILAHSMGTRALANALKDISFMYDKPQFKNIILAAPDIDAEVFESNPYPYILKTTEEISVFRDVVTIDASGIDTTLLGHSYFSQKSDQIL